MIGTNLLILWAIIDWRNKQTNHGSLHSVLLLLTQILLLFNGFRSLFASTMLEIHFVTWFSCLLCI
eukprot:UN00344